jgi:hypothetical protein
VVTGAEPRDDPEEFFDDLITWLRDNDFVSFSQVVDGAAFNVALTEKGYAERSTRRLPDVWLANHSACVIAVDIVVISTFEFFNASLSCAIR